MVSRNPTYLNPMMTTIGIGKHGDLFPLPLVSEEGFIKCL